MKKIIFALILSANAALFPKNSFIDLQNTVKQRSIDAGKSFAATHAEFCRSEALASRVMEQAENTRIFLQEFNYCETANPKNKKTKINDTATNQITKKIIPAIMKENRSIDRIDRALKTVSTQFDKDRAELKKTFLQNQNNTQKKLQNQNFKQLIILGKSFRTLLDDTKTHYQELLGIELRLINWREKLIELENPFIKRQQQLAQSLPAQEETQEETWSIADWIGSIFDTEKKTETSQTEQQKIEFQKIKQKRLVAEEQLNNIKTPNASIKSTPKPIKNNNNLELATDLDMQIKRLGESIQKLSANIDDQFKDLEILTKNIASESLSQVNF